MLILEAMNTKLPLNPEVPVIETDRLRLRGHRVGDFEDCAAMWAEPEVTRHIGGKPFTAQQTWTKILAYGGLWRMLGYGYWALEEKSSGRFIGELGFADFKREIVPSMSGTPEVGWVLASRAHGKGYATEALSAALKWGEGAFGKARTVCLISPENAPSIRVAKKCGYQEWGQAHLSGQPTVLFERVAAIG